ncbi:MAG: ribonuclease HI family protein [Caryophanon sp.]|nr:ribonuclease HI family protein [Caryophanon sp.]
MLEVYVDAATAGNPGKSGIGIFIKGEGHLLKFSEPIKPMTNNEAEFVALVRGLEEAMKLNPSIVSLRSDSKVVVASVDKRYVKNAAFKPHLEAALALIDTLPLCFIKWIPDVENRAADALAREAIHR